jgi:putative transcriptional regulator
MKPNHHPYPETLISYGTGTLPGAVACIVACHLSMCNECTKQIRWLEMLGGLLLSSLETNTAEPPLAERISGQSPRSRQLAECNHKPVTQTDDPLLPMPLARYLGANGAEIAWKPVGKGKRERSIELPNASGSIKLLRLSPGHLLPEHSSPLETKVALVLEGACHDNIGTYVCGDIIEWSEDPTHWPMVFGERECVCLVSDMATG